MTLEDLKQRWDDQDRRLDVSLRLNTRLLQATGLGQTATAMSRLSRWLWVEVILNLAAAVWLGAFIADHLADARFLLPAVVLDVCMVLMAVAGIHQLVALAGLDYGAPIVAIQQRIESLKIQRIRATKLTLLMAPVVWTPLLIVTLKGLFGVDAYATLPGGWLLANALVGLAVIPLALWGSRRFAGRMERSPVAQRLMRDLAGHNLNAATGFLAALAGFAEETEATEDHEQRA